MSQRESEANLAFSTASLWPAVHFMSARTQERFANKLGFDQLELIPSAGIIFETKRKGELGLQNPIAVRALHTGRQNNDYTFFPEAATIPVLQQLEKRYGTHVIFQCPTDVRRYERPSLEIQPDTSLTPEQLLAWASDDVRKQLVMDIGGNDVFHYLRQHGICETEEQMRVYKQLLAQTRHVHFQLKRRTDMHAVMNLDTNTQLGHLTRQVKERGIPIAINTNMFHIATQYGVNPITVYRKSAAFIQNV